MTVSGEPLAGTALPASARRATATAGAVPRRGPAQPAAAGFTLIELLVVMVIIGLLAGLLLPALAQAKASALRVKCLAREKQWALAFQLYAEDNDGWLPREGYHRNGEVYWNNWAHVQDAASKDVWYNGLAAYVGLPAASRYVLPSERPFFYQRQNFFQCPAARFPKASASFGFQIALFSLAMNSQLVNPPDVPIVKLDRVKRPALTVLMLDNLLEDEKPVVEEQAQDNLGQPAAYANRYAGRRHGRSGNIAFFDGHSETIAGTQVVATNGINAGWAILPPDRVFWETE